MTHNVTLAIDKDLLRKARRIALERDTSVNQLIRGFLLELVHQEDRRQNALSRLEGHMTQHRVAVGERSWRREDLYER